MPKCIKTISVDAMQLFEIYFDVAALFYLRSSLLMLLSTTVVGTHSKP